VIPCFPGRAARVQKKKGFYPTGRQKRGLGR
jgi:hypothetical protein